MTHMCLNCGWLIQRGSHLGCYAYGPWRKWVAKSDAKRETFCHDWEASAEEGFGHDVPTVDPLPDYPIEVKLIAITRVPYSIDNPVPCVGASGAEALIEWAGRLCYNVEDKTGTRSGWIQERIKDGHESILEHSSMTFYIRASRVLTHELVRHRIASYSQRSQRYVKETEPKYIMPPELVGQVLVDPDTGGKVAVEPYFDVAMSYAWAVYRDLLRAGVKPEIARYVLPNACQTEIVMTMNFRELRHFIKLRTSKRALPEMRCVAGRVRDICKQVAPSVFEDL